MERILERLRLPVYEGVNMKRLWVGGLLVLLGLCMPLLVNVKNFGIYETLWKALREQEKFYVVLAAFKLAMLNCIRCIPHYLGGFFLSEAIELRHNGKRPALLHAAVAFAVIPLVYLFIELLYGIRYDFSGPALLLILMLIMLEKADFSMVNLSKKALMVIALIGAMQFLDVMPALQGLPFGRGETSLDIKRVAVFLDAQGFLQISVSVVFVLLLFNSVLLCKLIMDENRLRTLGELREQNERMRTKQRIREMEARTSQELRFLVHDLKTPLTSAQALIGVVGMISRRDGDGKSAEYLGRVEQSLDLMSGMISEILYEDRRNWITVRALLNALLAQTSNAEYARLLHVSEELPACSVKVNRIRFLRVLINLIENAYHALDSTNGEIRVEVEVQEGTDQLLLRIADNGKGISPADLEQIWQVGFSTRGSHGLGMSFVQQVVESNAGSIEVESMLGRGTTFTICLKTREDGEMGRNLEWPGAEEESQDERIY